MPLHSDIKLINQTNCAIMKSERGDPMCIHILKLYIAQWINLLANAEKVPTTTINVPSIVMVLLNV